MEDQKKQEIFADAYCWVLYNKILCNNENKNQSKVNFIRRFENVKDFCNYYKGFPPLKNLAYGCALSLSREGILPEINDSHNQNGTTVKITFENAQDIEICNRIDHFWFTILATCISNQYVWTDFVNSIIFLSEADKTNEKAIMLLLSTSSEKKSEKIADFLINFYGMSEFKKRLNSSKNSQYMEMDLNQKLSNK